ncbi:MAG TPA: endonuclease/exonuclease/phosphatase family protein [Pyrinomonadaceae bacterium]|nr:endonuclease/exonuclease/phosphatase family protein [Pyrinomonadaceae bacterium]
MMLRLLTYNIRKGGRGREMAIAEVIRGWGPDLVLLQEATDTRVVSSLSELAELPFYGSRRGYSTGFLSRTEPESFKWLELPAIRRAVLEICLPELTVFNVHLRAVHSNWTEQGRKRELGALLGLIRSEAASPHLIAGDLNTLAPNEDLDLRKLPPRLRLVNWVTGGKVRYETIQIMLDAGYIDAYRSLHYDKGFTFPTWDPHVRLDFVFAPGDVAERVTECEVITSPPAASASDHFPLGAIIR